jgi:hypothetical protein
VGKRDRELDLQRSLREIRRAIDAYKDASDDGRIEKSITDNPQEGEDVFDVSSRSTRESLNGTSYSQW